ncbi:MAG: hypothetical protein WCI74_19495, partial [Actinomycetes bacterium]
DALHGYVAGGYSANDGVLAYTSDGGKTWKPSQHSQQRMQAVCASFDGLSATASSDYTDAVVSTTNNGGSWSTESPVFSVIDPHIYDVAYLSGRRAVVGQKVTPANGNVAALSSRLDGGSWTEVFAGPLYPLPGNGDPAPLTYAQLPSVDATANGQYAWAVGTEFLDSSYTSVVHSLILRTTDGGANWVSDTGNPDTLLKDITAVTAASADVAFATTRQGTLGNRVLLRRIGGTWQSSTMAAVPVAFQANAIDAFDADHLVVVGDSGKIAYTSNASSATPTWEMLSTPSATNHLKGVQMIGPDSWIAVGLNETVVRFTNRVADPAGSYALAAPKVAITSPAPSFSLPVASIAGTSADIGVGVLKVDVQIQRDGGTYWNGFSWVAEPVWVSADGTTSWSYSFIPGSPGPQSVTITARATDGMGQETQASVSSAAGPAPDTTAPITTAFPTPTNAFDTGVWVSSNVTITLSAVDASSGIAWTRYSIGGAAEQSATVAVISTEGTTTFAYRSKDSQGNTETVNNRTVRIDKTAPVTNSAILASYPPLSGAKITLTPLDTGGSGAVSTAWRITKNPGAVFESAGATTVVPVPSAVGTYTLEYSSADAVGNKETTKTA